MPSGEHCQHAVNLIDFLKFDEDFISFRQRNQSKEDNSFIEPVMRCLGDNGMQITNVHVYSRDILADLIC